MPKNTGHGSRRENDGPSIGKFNEARKVGGSFGTEEPAAERGGETCGHTYPDGTRCTLTSHDVPGLDYHRPAPQAEPEWLADFPVDDAMLARIEHALGGAYSIEDGEHVLVGADYTLSQLLDFMSGYDPANLIQMADAPNLFGEDVSWAEYPFPVYHEHDLIRALIAEVRRLRATPAEATP